MTAVVAVMGQMRLVSGRGAFAVGYDKHEEEQAATVTGHQRSRLVIRRAPFAVDCELHKASPDGAGSDEGAMQAGRKMIATDGSMDGLMACSSSNNIASKQE
ncbi:uncharacterized protein [Physcomitrium patens]|uniref:uncharacterized protein n=1 Tax=Physcomitrium patens TaxID=3218 RepID=UPI0001623E4B